MNLMKGVDNQDDGVVEDGKLSLLIGERGGVVHEDAEDQAHDQPERSLT